MSLPWLDELSKTSAFSSINLSQQVIQNFINNKIGVESFFLLKERHLKELGVTDTGTLRALLNIIENALTASSEEEEEEKEPLHVKTCFKAVERYTLALSNNPSDTVTQAALLSKRSACHLKLQDYAAALKDAEECINLRPDWVTSHLRRGHALFATNEPLQALASIHKALELDPTNQEAIDASNEVSAFFAARFPSRTTILTSELEPFLRAVAEENIEEIEHMLKDDTKAKELLLAPGSHGEKPIHIAAHTRCPLHIVQYLVDRARQVGVLKNALTALNNQGYSFLIIAVAQSLQLDSLRILLDAAKECGVEKEVLKMYDNISPLEIAGVLNCSADAIALVAKCMADIGVLEEHASRGLLTIVMDDPDVSAERFHLFLRLCVRARQQETNLKVLTARTDHSQNILIVLVKNDRDDLLKLTIAHYVSAEEFISASSKKDVFGRRAIDYARSQRVRDLFSDSTLFATCCSEYYYTYGRKPFDACELKDVNVRVPWLQRHFPNPLDNEVIGIIVKNKIDEESFSNLTDDAMNKMNVSPVLRQRFLPLKNPHVSDQADVQSQ